MLIQLTSGVGTGPTSLAAFDSALLSAGIANYNLIYLSSVIPPGATLEEVDGSSIKLDGNWGDRLYIVKAEHRVDAPNAEAWAGIGWASDPATGQGLFVEHQGENEGKVRRDIGDTLTQMIRDRGLDLPIQMKVVGATCRRDPVCALVAAVYQAADWSKPAAAETETKGKVARRLKSFARS